MFRPRVIPCLLLRDRGLVKTVRFRRARYIGDPMNTVRIFNAKEADELVLLDIRAWAEDRIAPLELVEKIAHETYMPFAVGGGIRRTEDIRALLNAGAEKVVINSGAWERPEFVKRASEMFGSSTIVVSMDVGRRWLGRREVVTSGATRRTGRDPVAAAVEMQEMGAGELLVTAVDHDGVMGGYDIDLVRSIADAVDVPVVASGGAGKLEDLVDAVERGGASAVAAGSLFVYHGPRRAVLISFPTQQQLRELFMPAIPKERGNA